jgi:hypothetical protein
VNIGLLLGLLLQTMTAKAGTPDRVAEPLPPVNFVVTVLDRSAHAPLELVRVALTRGKSVIAVRTTNVNGRAVFKDVQPGWYTLNARYVGYQSYADSILIDSLHTSDTVNLVETQHEEVVVSGERTEEQQHIVTSVDVQEGSQIFEGATYHAPPVARMTQLVQQNIAGATRAPTGEVHVRGQHGEFTYYVDGVPIPLGVFGGLNEVVDPKVIDRATFYTGGFPAEYGGQMAAVVDVQNSVPAGRFHLDASTYIGSYLTKRDSLSGSRLGAFRAINSNGQNLSVSDHIGSFGYFLSGSRQETDRRIDQPVPELFHDHGFDYFLYGKLHYLIDEKQYLTMNLNYGVTQTDVPYDSTEGIRNDEQRTYNAFQTLSYFRTFSDQIDNESNLLVALYAREGGLRYTPSLNDEPKQFIGNDTLNGYVVDENRAFTTLGVRTKYDLRISHQLGLAAGLDLNSTTGTEDFNFRSTEVPGPRTTSNFSGSDLGLFAQSEWHPAEWTRLDLGVRYDQHIAPDVPLQSQASPRVKLSFFPDDLNTIYFYYGRLFMPTNIEGLRQIASQLGGNSGATLPERDHFYEAVYSRNWEFGLTSKLAAFYKNVSPGLDDEALGSSAIKVNVNIANVRTTGLELALAYSDPTGPFSAYANAALIHAYGRGPVSGGFLAADSSSDIFDLDHDQRLAVVLGLNYQPESWFANLTATYGSGLTNGNDDAVFKTGLFDFNQEAHTTPAWIFNLSGGYTFDLGNGQTLESSLYITNLLDHGHLLKGAFFSGASFEERRNVIFKLSCHL